MGKMLMKRMGIGSACFFLVLVLLMGISSRSSAADTIKIGILAPFSGPFEFVGRQQKAAVDFVVDEQNAKGGCSAIRLRLLQRIVRINQTWASERRNNSSSKRRLI